MGTTPRPSTRIPLLLASILIMNSPYGIPDVLHSIQETLLPGYVSPVMGIAEVAVEVPVELGCLSPTPSLLLH